jgi:hypothetical protein
MVVTVIIVTYLMIGYCQPTVFLSEPLLLSSSVAGVLIITKEAIQQDFVRFSCVF